eukprot:20162-Heterococcus_DN1.PRE.3
MHYTVKRQGSYCRRNTDVMQLFDGSDEDTDSICCRCSTLLPVALLNHAAPLHLYCGNCQTLLPGHANTASIDHKAESFEHGATITASSCRYSAGFYKFHLYGSLYWC